MGEEPPEVVEMLLNAGADPNAADNDGVTPLMEAVVVRSPELVKLLLRRGADVTMADEQGRTALDYARKRKHRVIVAMLESAAATTSGERGN
jgi:ankyrin repeat protein